MSISKVYLCLIFLTFLTSPPVLCSRSPRLAEVLAPIEKKLKNGHIHSPALLVAEALAPIEKKLEKGHIHSPALLVSGSQKVDSSSSMTKIVEPTTNSGISSFFRYKFPFQGWPFHKYAPFPMVRPTNPSLTTPSSGAAAAEEESEKVPSSPNKGNGDGGNA